VPAGRDSKASSAWYPACRRRSAGLLVTPWDFFCPKKIPAPIPASANEVRANRRADEQTEQEESGGFCCQVPPNPACRSLTRQDFKVVFQTALRSLSNRSIVVVCNYCMARYRRNHTEKKRVLYALVDPVSPPPKPSGMIRKSGFRKALVEAPGTAPGSEWFIATVIYFHSRRTGTLNIGCNG